MKKIVCLFFMSFAMNLIFAEVVNTDTLNIRSAPNANSEVIGKLERGTSVTVLSVENDWAKISYNGKDGWVAVRFLEKDDNDKVPDKEKKTFVSVVLSLLWKIIKGIISLIFFVGKPISSFMVMLGFGWFSIIPTIIVEVLFFVIILVILLKTIDWIREQIKYRCKKCGKFGALKYTGQSETVDTWTKWETKTERSEQTFDRNGELISYSEKDVHIPIKMEYIRKLYRCKHCGNEVFINDIVRKVK